MFKKLWEKWTKSNNPESKRYRYDMAKRICGHHVKYVTERIDNLEATGAVRIGGLVWTARSLEGDVIEPDTYVTFEKIEGNKALVKKKGE